jgi:hypothetical protein
LVTQSEYFGAWAANGTATRTANATTSPEGLNNAYLIEAQPTSFGYFVVPVGTTGIGDTYTYSIYAKIKSGSPSNIVRFGLGGGAFGGDKLSDFDLSNGTIVNQSAASDSVSIESVGDGWYRLIVTDTTTAASAIATPIYSATSEVHFYAWGAQLEAGSYPTSYIPTYGTSASRAGDSCVKTGISSLIGQTEGTFFFQIGEKTTESIAIFEAGQGSAQYRFFVYTDTSNKLKVLVVDNFSVQVSYTSSVNVESNAKIAIAYASNDYAIYMNGSQLSTDTSASVPPMNQLAVGSDRSGVATATNNTKQALLFKTRLTNAELAALTTI